MSRTAPPSLRHRLRRVVTAVDAAGRSYVSADDGPSPVLEFAPDDGLYEIWSDPDEDSSGRVRLLPPAAGVKCRWFTVVPEPPGVEPAVLAPAYEAAFRAMGGEDVRPDVSRHPGMHLTHTLDFIVVIHGHVRLILDKEERDLRAGDVVVQRATNHAWACLGDTPALLAAILIDRSARPAPRRRS